MTETQQRGQTQQSVQTQKGPEIFIESLQDPQQIGRSLIVHGSFTTARAGYSVSCTLTQTSDGTIVSPDIIETDLSAGTWWASFSNLQAGATYRADAVLRLNTSTLDTTTVNNLTVNANLAAACILAPNSTIAHNATLNGGFTTGYGVQCCVYQGPTIVQCGSTITFPEGLWGSVFNLPFPKSGCRVLTELVSGPFVLAGSVVDNLSIPQ